MKRIVLSIVVLLVLLCGIAVAEGSTIVAEGECGKNGSNLTWTLDSEGKLCISGKGYMKDFSWYGSPWYSNRTTIKTAVIQKGVTSIGDHAFNDCINLNSIDISGDIVYIGEYAFNGCCNLNKVYAESLEDWLSVSYSNVFSAPLNNGGELYIADKPIADLVLPNCITQINNCAFYGCRNLTSIIIPDGVTLIGDYAFYDCSGLVSVDFSGNVTTIGYSAFHCCSSLSSIEIPDGVTFINDCAFYGCSSLESIGIPEGVLSINEAVFYGCENLHSISIPEGVTSIGRLAFSGCRSLNNLDIPSSVTYIGDEAFYNCSGLRNIDIPKGVKSIGWYLFYNCSSLNSVIISEGPTSIGCYAFKNCNNLSSIVVPASVTSIGDSAFEDCYNLRSMIFLGEDMPSIGSNAIPDSPTIYCHKGSEVAEWAMKNGYTIEYLEDHTHIPVTDPAVPATHVTTGLTEGSHCAVCGEILVAQKIVPVVEVKKLVLPAELEVIEAEAFAGDSFVCVVLPEGCKAIGAGAFRACVQLRFIEIPESVDYIDGSAFDGCGGLIIVTVPSSAALCFAQEKGITYVLR